MSVLLYGLTASKRYGNTTFCLFQRFIRGNNDSKIHVVEIIVCEDDFKTSFVHFFSVILT